MIKGLFNWLALVMLFAVLGAASIGLDDVKAETASAREFIVQADLGKINTNERSRGAQSFEIKQVMKSAIKVIEARLSVDRSPWHTVTHEGDGRLRIRAPASVKRSSVETLLGIAADLSIRLVNDDALASDLEAGIVRDGYTLMPTTEKGAPLAVSSEEALSGDHVIKARSGIDLYTDEHVINIGFDRIGREKFAALTSANVGRRITLVLDGEVLVAPVVNEPVTGGAVQISGSFTAESANNLAIMLQSGALPVPFEIVEERIVE